MKSTQMKDRLLMDSVRGIGANCLKTMRAPQVGIKK